MQAFSEQMQRWTAVAERSLNRFEQMVIARPFVYSAYWSSWSRVIKPVVQGKPYGIIELNLTPLPLVSSSTWENYVLPMKMRVHTTMASRDDKYERELPADVFNLLVDNVGLLQAQVMCSDDLWIAIDISKLEAANRTNLLGGGIPFSLFRKE